MLCRLRSRDSVPRLHFHSNNKVKIASQLLDGLNRLRQNGTFCDIIVRVGDTAISAHKNVLCACSPYFDAMFSGPFLESDQNEIVIKDVDAMSLEIIVNFLYTGQLKFNSNNVEKVLLTASFLQISSAEELCCSFMVNNLVFENCIETIIFAGKHSIQNLLEKSIEMASINFHRVSQKDDYMAIDFEEFNQLIANLKSNGNTEDAIYTCIMRWIHHSYEARVSFIDDLLKHINPLLVSPDILNSSRILARPIPYLQNWAARANSVAANESDEQIIIYKRVGDFKPRAVKIMTQAQQCELEPLPQRISDGSYVCNGFYVYHQGGWINKRKLATDAYVFHQHANVWTPIAPLLQARAYHRSCILDGTIYTLGGSDGLKALPSVEFFDLHTGRSGWSDVLPRPKEQMGVAIHENSIYTVGGKDRAVNLKCSHRMDPRTGKWEEIAASPYRAGSSSCGVINDNIYTTHPDALQRYDIRANRWTLIKTQYNRYPGEVFTIRDYLYGLFKDHIARYIPEEGKWQMQRTLGYRHDHLRVATNLLHLNGDHLDLAVEELLAEVDDE